MGERGRRLERRGCDQTVKGGKWGPLTAVKGIYTLTTRTLWARFGVFGKPGLSEKNPGVSTPPESSEKICKEFDFG
jgi:hypothetical protein